MAKVQLGPRELEDCLLDSCFAGDEQKLVIDLICLLKSDIAKKKPVQILVLQNIVSKPLKDNNHHYASLIKDLSGLFQNELGPTNYALLSEVFGLARSSTASQHGSEMRLDPGINSQALLTVCNLCKDSPVNEASDGERALRYLEERKKADGNVILVGEGWDPNVKRWHSKEVMISRNDEEKGDEDDFTALADLLDAYVPGSQDTSLYVQAVFHLIEPFRKPDFGSPFRLMWYYHRTLVEKSPRASETFTPAESWSQNDTSK